jgi:hypothetical protein
MNEAASVEPPEVKTRFATVDDAAFEKLLYEKDAKNTRRGTKSALQTFRSYLREKDITEEFENLPNEELDKILSTFYTEARTESGKKYKKSSLVSIRHGINRYLSDADAKDIIHICINFVLHDMFYCAIFNLCNFIMHVGLKSSWELMLYCYKMYRL